MNANTYHHLLFYELKTSSHSPLPNGGWGWAVVFASSVVSLLGDGFSYSIGEFYKQFLIIYKESETITSIFTSMMTGVTLCSAPLTSGLIEVYGCRIVSLVGATLSVCGILLAVLLDQYIYCHWVTLGLITGLGLGFLYVTQLMILTSWFDKKLPLATGLAACGTGFGMGCFSLFNGYLIEIFGWKGSMIILASIMSFCLSMSALYVQPTVQYFHFHSLFCWDKFCEALRKANDFELMKDVTFLLVVLSTSLLSSVYYAPFVLTPDRIVSAGMGSTAEANMLLLYLGIFNGIGRVLSGYIFTLEGINLVWLYFGIMIIMGILLILIALIQSINQMIAPFVFFGLFSGASIIAMPVTLVQMFGQVRVANAFGIVSFFNGLATVFGLPLLNLTVKPKQLPGDHYQMPLIISGLVTLLAAFCLLSIPLTQMLTNKAKTMQCKS